MLKEETEEEEGEEGEEEKKCFLATSDSIIFSHHDGHG